MCVKMAEQEESFVLGAYQPGSDEVNAYFNNDNDLSHYEMLRFYYDKEAQVDESLYGVHIRRYTITVRFKESFKCKDLYARAVIGHQEGNHHSIYLDRSYVLMCGTTYATIERQLEVLKERLFYDTFQEEMGRMCHCIESVVVLDFPLDYERLFKEWAFECDEDNQYSIAVKYSELPVSDSIVVKVGLSIEGFEDIGIEEGESDDDEEEEDFGILLIISREIIIVIVRSDRSDFVKAHGKLQALFTAYRVRDIKEKK